jgi:hypothetical protein
MATLTASYDPVLSRIRLAGTLLGASATYAVFERSDNGFVSSVVVRGGSHVTVTSQNAAVDDYEWTPGATTTYRVTSYNVSNVQQAQTATSLVQDLTSVWLKVPAAPFLNAPVTVVDRSDITRRSRSGLFDVVGRTMPVMVGDVASSLAYTLQLLTETPAEERDLDYLFASGEVVFLQLPSTVEHFPGGYFTAGDVSREPTLRLSPRRVWTVPLTEVAIPGPAVVGSAYTIASMLAEYATISAVIADNATIADLLERTGIPSDVIVP